MSILIPRLRKPMPLLGLVPSTRTKKPIYQEKKIMTNQYEFLMLLLTIIQNTKVMVIKGET